MKARMNGPGRLGAAAALILLGLTAIAAWTNAVLVSVSPPEGPSGAEVQVPIAIDGSAEPIGAFGLDVSFPAAMFEYLGAGKGPLTSDWSFVAANPAKPGQLRVGAYAGSGTKIAPGRTGALVVLRFRVTCGACDKGTTGKFCVSGFVDGLAGMDGSDSCALFTLK
jgi:hypothetical protein